MRYKGQMANSSFSPVTIVAAAALMAGVAGASWYIATMRAENEALKWELSQRPPDTAPAPQAAQAPAPAPAAAPRAQAPAAAPANAPPRVLTADQRTAMLERLKTETGFDRFVWFTNAPNNPESANFQKAIQGVFEEAGWEVRSSAPASFSLRAGIYFLMAEEEPPQYVTTALSALEAANLTVTAGRGYREFHASRKAADPNWRGFDFANDQTYIIAVGSQPAS